MLNVNQNQIATRFTSSEKEQHNNFGIFTKDSIAQFCFTVLKLVILQLRYLTLFC